MPADIPIPTRARIGARALEAAYPSRDEDWDAARAIDLLVDVLHYIDTCGAAYTADVYAHRAIKMYLTEREG